MAALYSLYIENRTRQVHNFNYWLPGELHLRSDTIEPGKELRIYREASLAVLRAIIDPHRQYGLTPIDKAAAGFVGLCYRFDPPADYEEEERLWVARQRAKEEKRQRAIELAALDQMQAPSSEGKRASKEKPPFDRKQAQSLLIAQKASGIWKEPPPAKETAAFLRPHFNGIPSDPHREVRHKVWPGLIRRGPKPKPKKPAK